MRGVDLSVDDGEIFGFLGPNGAGKTTTMRMLATLLPPTSGRAKICGYELLREAENLRDEVRLVNSFGSYNDAISLVVDVASQSIVVDGSTRAWTPEQRTLDVISNALVDAGVSEADRSELLGGTSRERAMQIADSFPPDVRARLTDVSPSAVLDRLHAHLYLMHDVNDPFLPFTESRDLVASAPPGVVSRYTEFSIFEHVIPDRPVPWQAFLPDLWRLFWHVHAVLLELL